MAKEIKLELELTNSEWCELVNAVGTKATRVENGSYFDDDITREDLKQWAVELRRIYKKVTAILDKNKISY